jgi:hypothetical protein
VSFGDGAFELVVSDPGSGHTEEVIFDGTTLLTPRTRVLS